MRKWLFCGVLLVALATPLAALAAKGWIAIPASYAPKIKTRFMAPVVRAAGNGVRITSCSFQQRSRFYVCVFGTQAAPKGGAVEVERTKRCEYTAIVLDLKNPKKPKVTATTRLHHCF